MNIVSYLSNEKYSRKINKRLIFMQNNIDLIPENQVRKTVNLTYFTVLLSGFAFPVMGLISPHI